MTNNLNVGDGKNIYDVALSLYGNVESILGLIGSTNGFVNLDYDLKGGVILNYIPLGYEISLPLPSLKLKKQVPFTYSAIENQTIYDVALQMYGNPSAAINVAIGCGQNLDFNMLYQTVSTIDYNVVTQDYVLNFYTVQNHIVASKGVEKTIIKYLGAESLYILTTEDGKKIIL